MCTTTSTTLTPTSTQTSCRSSLFSRPCSKASSRGSISTATTTKLSTPGGSLLKRSQSSFSRQLGKAALNTLYPDSKTKISVSHLEPYEMIWFMECLKHPACTYYNDAELHQRTAQLIQALPKNLCNPVGGSRLSQSTITRFCKKIGASPDTLPQASVLCKKHTALSGQLTSSLRNYFEYVAEDLSLDVTSFIGRTRLRENAQEVTRSLLRHAEDLMVLSLDAANFCATYHRKPSICYPRQQCDACFVETALQSVDAICGLRGIALRACDAGIIDDLGNDRSRVAKMLLEACMATFPKDDAILMVSISDAMAQDLMRLAQEAETEMSVTVHKDVPTDTGLLPAPLQVRKGPGAASDAPAGKYDVAKAFWEVREEGGCATPKPWNGDRIQIEHGHRPVISRSASATPATDACARAASTRSQHTAASSRPAGATLPPSSSQSPPQHAANPQRIAHPTRLAPQPQPKRAASITSRKPVPAPLPVNQPRRQRQDTSLPRSARPRMPVSACALEAAQKTGCWNRAYARGVVPFPLVSRESALAGGWI